jgi:hypothetical protein
MPVSPRLSVGWLDLDHIRAEVGQDCRCCGTRDKVRKINYLTASFRSGCANWRVSIRVLAIGVCICTFTGRWE